MGVEFNNAYQEILLDNLMAIIKQNFVFQTQLKMYEGSEKQKEEIESQFNDLRIKFEELNGLYNQTKNDLKQVDAYKLKAEQSNIFLEEKSRIQTALNESMKKISFLENTINSNNKEINELKTYILKLEEIVPVTKLNKLKNVKTAEIKNELPKIENKLQVKVIENGSSF